MSKTKEDTPMEVEEDEDEDKMIEDEEMEEDNEDEEDEEVDDEDSGSDDSSSSDEEEEEENEEDMEEDKEEGDRSDVIVFQPGECTIRVGFAYASEPTNIPNVVAVRRRDTPETVVQTVEENSEEKVVDDGTIRVNARAVSRVREKLQKDDRFQLPKPMRGGGYELEEEYVEESEWTWSNPPDSPKMVFGDEAVRIRPDEPYDHIYPFRSPNFAPQNVSRTFTIIEEQWLHAITHTSGMNIKKEDIPSYRIILLVPDRCPHGVVKKFVDLMLNVYGFKAILVVQESICTTFTAGVSTACVVDMGFRTTKITCIEDGLIVPQSCIVLPYGGDHVTRMLMKMFQNTLNWPAPEMSLKNMCDYVTADDAKCRLCHLSAVESNTARSYNFKVQRPDQIDKGPDIRRVYGLTDALYVPPMLFFHPDLAYKQELLDGKAWFGICGTSLGESDMTEGYVEDEWWIDLMRYALERRPGKKAAAPTETNPTTTATTKTDKTPPPTNTTNTTKPAIQPPVPEKKEELVVISEKNEVKEEGEECTALPLSLDAAIVESIKLVGKPEITRKFFMNVLLAGGSSLFPAMRDMIEGRVVEIMPESVDTVDVLFQPKDTDARIQTWKGGCLIPLLNASSELWITQSEWKDSGPAVLFTHY